MKLLEALKAVFTQQDVKDLARITIKGNHYIIVGKNNDYLQFVRKMTILNKLILSNAHFYAYNHQIYILPFALEGCSFLRFLQANRKLQRTSIQQYLVYQDPQ